MQGRFDAREAFAKARRKVKAGGSSSPPKPPFRALINRVGQAFACAGETAYLKRIMPDDRIASAFERIEAALSRIERSARAPLSSTQSCEPDIDLAERHAKLRETVTASLGELDRLIESLET